MSPDPVPPTHAIKRDGRQVPFDTDRISRALFAATESLGRPDAFLARELADSIVHFLAQEIDATPTTQQIAEVVVKVARELGHPELARHFAQHKRDKSPQPPKLAATLADAMRRFTLQAVYTRDLAAACDAGLLVLSGLEAPDRLASCVLGPPVTQAGELTGDLDQARHFAHRLVALDGPEHHAPQPGFAPAIAAGARLASLSAVVNLNVTAPSAAIDLAVGPLFGTALATSIRTDAAFALASELLRQPPPRPRIDWHLREGDFAGPGREYLQQLLAAVQAQGAEVGFVFDRPRRPVALAEGLDRNHPAVLLEVGLDLQVLARQPGMLADADRFCQRLGSLVRLALSAAVQKRRYLREHARQTPRSATMTSGFLLDRAVFVATPIGLDEVVRQFTGWGLCNAGESLELGRQIVRRLVEVLEQDGRAAQLDACLDGPFAFALEGRDSAGLSPNDPAAVPKSQLRGAGAIQAIAERGTAVVTLPPGEGVEVLEFAWRQTEVARVAFRFA